MDVGTRLTIQNRPDDTPAKKPPHWRREIEGTDHGRSWAGVLLGALVTFLMMELPALGKPGQTLSEAVWSIARPFSLGWWMILPPLLGLFCWLWPHFAFRVWGAAALGVWVLVAYAACVIVWAVLR